MSQYYILSYEWVCKIDYTRHITAWICSKSVRIWRLWQINENGCQKTTVKLLYVYFTQQLKTRTILDWNTWSNL